MYKEFGFLVAFSSACSSALRFPMAITRWKDRCIVRWLKKKYSSVILRHRQYATPKENSGEVPVIWSVWWQGTENVPDLVKMCFASINMHRGEHSFIIITKDNYRKYIDLPEHIIRKVQAGIITLTHLSDIIRFCLLAKYGGLWVDATILATENISAEIFGYDYYVIRHEENPGSYGVNRDRWISFLQAGKKGNQLCKFGYDFLVEYWKDRNFLIDYMLIDYAIEIAYEEFPECKRLIDAVPLNNPAVDSLRPIMNEEYDAVSFEKLMEATNFFKLTYKHKLVKAKDDHETFYGRLARNFAQ